MKKIITTVAVLAFGPVLPASADPALGVGVSFAFGSGGFETGVGVRAFTTDRREEAAATVGIDYMFQSGRFRPTIGAAYMTKNSYIGLDMGFGLNGEGLDFGLGVGATDTSDKRTVVAAPEGGEGEGEGDGPIVEEGGDDGELG